MLYLCQKLVRKRKKQEAFNKEKGLTPQPLIKKSESNLIQSLNPYKITTPNTKPIIDSSSVKQLQKMVCTACTKMFEEHSKGELYRCMFRLQGTLVASAVENSGGGKIGSKEA